MSSRADRKSIRTPLAAGFSLFELLLAIGIVGLLFAFAPKIQRYLGGSLVALDTTPLAGIVRQNLAFSAPAWMALGSQESVEVAIGGDKPVEALLDMLKRLGQSGGREIRVSGRMAAKLVGSGFKITPITAEIQEVSRTEVTIWKWTIEATSRGKQPLYLVVDALNPVEGKDAARSTTFDKVIIVEIDSMEAVWAWAVQNWIVVSFVVTAIGGLVAFLLNRKFASSKRS